MALNIYPGGERLVLLVVMLRAADKHNASALFQTQFRGGSREALVPHGFSSRPVPLAYLGNC